MGHGLVALDRVRRARLCGRKGGHGLHGFGAAFGKHFVKQTRAIEYLLASCRTRSAARGSKRE